MRRALYIVLLAAVLAAPASVRAAGLIDLHTHLVGAVSSAGLYDIAVEHDVLLPREMFRQMHVGIPPEAEQGGRLISMSQFHRHAPEAARKAFVAHLSFPDQSSYEALEVTYGFRKALMQPQRVFYDVVRQIGREAAAGGVRYVELATNKIFEIDAPLRDGLRQLVDEVEADTGVRLRFLHSFHRDAPVAQNVGELYAAERMGLYGHGSVVVGIDIIGREHNSIQDQARLLKEVQRLKKAHPSMKSLEVQVHAGETPDFPNNVRDSILLGATRIAHGVYGITDDVIQEARRRGVMFALAHTSNTKLATALSHGIYSKLINAGVDVTITSDGMGVFDVTLKQEIKRVIDKLALSRKQVQRMNHANLSYLQRKGAWKQARPQPARPKQAGTTPRRKK